MITTTEQLVSYLASISPTDGHITCAIDTEADSLHRYQESLCLIQFAHGKDVLLIDPLSIDDLSPLGNFLAKATVWMHGADYDMTMLRREFGTIPTTVYDTQIGARLLGARRYGLADLVEQTFGITLTKSSQKADWGKRPLSDKMVEYALNDVRYLLEMGERIVNDLKSLGRYSWFVESCEAARLKVLDRSEQKEDAWRIQGSGKLTREGLAYLEKLWLWRDAEARTWDRPTFMVASNRTLLEWTESLLKGKSPELPRHFRPDRVKRFRAAIDAARTMDENDWPQRPKKSRTQRAPDFDQKLEQLTQRRNAVAESLNIEGSLIAPRAAIEAIAGGNDSAENLLMHWQRECLGW